MKREATLSRDTLAKIKAIRDSFGDTEYSRDEILPKTIEVIKSSPIDVDQMYIARAHSVLDNFDANDDRISAKQGDMFPDSAHVALGENKRIKRGAMTADHVMRRKTLIDKQMSAHQDAWQEESEHLNSVLHELVANPGLTIAELRKSSMPAAAE